MPSLIDNAIRHTPSGGDVLVSLVPDCGRLLVRVTDTGTGPSRNGSSSCTEAR